MTVDFSATVAADAFGTMAGDKDASSAERREAREGRKSGNQHDEDCQIRYTE